MQRRSEVEVGGDPLAYGESVKAGHRTGGGAGADLLSPYECC